MTINVQKQNNLQFADLNNDGFVYKDTKDPVTLQKFIEMRKYVYSLRDVTAKSLAENEGWDYGSDTHVIVAMDGDKCVGGSVVTINQCDNDTLIPIESDKFRFKDAFPDFELDKNPYASFKSFAILPEYAKWGISDNIFLCVYNLCISHNVTFLFTASHPSSARRNRVGLSRLRLGLDINVRDDVKLPYEERWNGEQRHLLVVDFRKLYEKDRSNIDKMVQEVIMKESA